MTPEIIEELNAMGWTIECVSPLEIRHVDGSFATQNAATMVIDSLREEQEGYRARLAVQTIHGCATIAKQSCDGLMKNLWISIENECIKALKK